MGKNLTDRAVRMIGDSIVPGLPPRDVQKLKREANLLYRKDGAEPFRYGLWHGRRLIDFAAHGGHTLLMEILVNHLHVDPLAPNHLGCTPLHIAAASGQDAMVNTLITKYNVALESVDDCGSTALSLAVSNVQNTALARLIFHGASLEVLNFFGRPIHAAAAVGNAQTARLICLNSPVTNAAVFGFCTPLATAVCSDNFETLKELLNVCTPDGDPLMYKAVACAPRQASALQIVQALLDAGANANRKDEDLFEDLAIVLAAKRGWPQVVQILLEHTDALPGIEWTVNGLLAYVQTNEFIQSDEARKQARGTSFALRIPQELDRRNLLAALLMCRIWGCDMDDRHQNFSSLCLITNSSALLAHKFLVITPNGLMGEACDLLKKGDTPGALLAARGAVALDPNNKFCTDFVDNMMARQETGPDVA